MVVIKYVVAASAAAVAHAFDVAALDTAVNVGVDANVDVKDAFANAACC